MKVTTLKGEDVLKYNCPHVYVVKRDTVVIYVGASISPIARLSRHDRFELQSSDTIELMPCTDRAEMLELEQKLIRQFSPKYNKAGVVKTVWRARVPAVKRTKAQRRDIYAG